MPALGKSLGFVAWKIIDPAPENFNHGGVEDFENKKAPRKIPERCAIWKLKLLPAEDGILGRLGDAELHDALGRDLDGFAGLGVAAQAGGAVAEHKLADAGQGECVFRVLVGERGNMVENFDGLLFGETVFLRDEGGDLSFRERASTTMRSFPARPSGG